MFCFIPVQMHQNFTSFLAEMGFLQKKAKNRETQHAVAA